MAYKLINLTFMLSLSCWLLGAWGMLDALQWLTRAGQWGTSGALGWNLQGLRQRRLYGARLLARIYKPLPLRILIIAHFLASLSLCLTLVSWGSVAALIVLILTSILLNLRSTADGADKMALVVAYGLLLQIAGASAELPLLSVAGILWVGGHLTLAYVTSGIGKIILSGWRNGHVPRKTLSSYLHGHRMAHGLVSRPGMAVTLAWSVILIEMLFPLALISPLPVLTGVLCIMALFHMATAMVMGLNTYPIAFVAAYPSLLLLAQWLNAFIN